ncbi:large ribosomal subunit protein eL27-like [Tenrec ecaudatus]|uniref:large ribosomal subunit protein eL27-like n=1 Tax=Tenrec ecaudatus TaxID=94439 RepID=UPI003F599381
MKPEKVVLVLAGHYSGHKAIIMKNTDGTSAHPYSHTLVAGIDCYPCKVTAAMGKKTIAKRSKIKSFVKMSKYNHLNKDVFRDPALKCKADWEAKVKFEERHKTVKNKWLFQKLRF